MERKDLIHGILIPIVAGLGIVVKTDSANLDEVHCSVIGQSSDEHQEDSREVDQMTVRVEDKNNFDKAKENLQATLTWMKSLGNLEIHEAAVCAEEEINEKNFLISANNKKAAFVTVASDPQRPQIVFSIKELSSGKFTRLEAAIDVFEAYHVYSKASRDPEGFTSDLVNRLISLEAEAKVTSSQAFSSIEQVNHN